MRHLTWIRSGRWLVLAFWSLSAWGTDSLRLEHLGLADGLRQSRILSMAEDQRGYLWLGTESGINLFDGHEVKPFQSDDSNAVLLSQRIRGLHPADGDAMWVVGTHGVAHVDPNADRVQYLAHRAVGIESETGYASRWPTTFIAGCDGRWLLLSGNYIVELSIDEGVASQKALLFNQVRPLRTGVIQAIFEFSPAVIGMRDTQGGLWLSDHQQLWHRPCGEEDFTLISTIAEEPSGEVLGLSSLAQDHAGDLYWAGSTGIQQIKKTPTGFDVDHFEPRVLFGKLVSSLSLTHDETGQLWAVTPDGFGLLHSSTGSGADNPLEYQPLYEAPPELSNLEYPLWEFSVHHSMDGLAWIRVEHRLFVIDLASGRIVHRNRLSNTATSWVHAPLDLLVPFYQDRFGVIWLTRGLGGISRYVAGRNRFCALNNPDENFNSARALAAVEIDNKLFIWASWDRGSLNLLEVSNRCELSLVHQFWQGNAASSNAMTVVRAIEPSEDGVVWLVSGDKLWRGDTRTQTMEPVQEMVLLDPNHDTRRYQNLDLEFNSKTNELIISIRTGVWVASLTEDQHLGSMRQVESIKPLLKEQSPTDLTLLSDGRLALGLSQGLALIDLSSDEALSYPISDADTRMPWADINAIAEGESPDHLWLATKDGLHRFVISEDRTDGQIVASWRREDGLADSTIYGLWLDEEQSIWVSSNRGISRLRIAEDSQAVVEIRNYTPNDGLPTYEFNTRSIDRMDSGLFIVGSIDGIASFIPSQLFINPHPPDVVLDQLLVNAESVPAFSSEVSHTLAYDENNLAIGYTGIHFSRASETEYAYWLEGLQEQWVNAGNERVARYYGLPPGEYHFWLRASNADGVWSEPRRLLSAVVKPPFWATSWAYSFYILCGLAIIAFFATASIRRQRALEGLVAQRTDALARQTEVVANQAKALENALEARTLFFANISHEFRTPLTLIQTAIDRLGPGHLEDDAKTMATRYLQRLTRLVDQLLDLSKLRLTGVRQADTPWSINQIVLITVDGFHFLAEERGITLDYRADGYYSTRADQASVEKILLNLVSNALKYTDRQGHVQVTVGGTSEEVAISVIDDGPGIAPESQALIFERFERIASQETLLREGAGIGLALVKEAVSAIGGVIELTSDEGQGSCFTVKFHATKESAEVGRATSPMTYLSGQRLKLDQQLLTYSIAQERHVPDPSDQVQEAQSQSVLVVEDNADLRRYLIELLRPDWQVFEAENGQVALDLLCDQEVDVVLADIMMPEMDGLELLRHVREEIDTSHIPFLLLSARHDTETRLLGLTLAADDFLTKPFLPEELRLKLRNAVAARGLLRQAIMREFRVDAGQQRAPQLASSEDYLSPSDHKFLRRLEQWMKDYYSDSDMTIVTMASGLAVNERTLQRKMRALTGLSPVHFLNQYRLARATEALTEPTLTIQEIAFSVGFNSQQTFARAFKSHFGVTPSQWRRGEEGDCETA